MEGFGTVILVYFSSKLQTIPFFGKVHFLFQNFSAFRILLDRRPDYHLKSFGQAERLLAEVSRPNAPVKLLFDFFHCQILHGYWTAMAGFVQYGISTTYDGKPRF
jgi:hypothetical protein